MQLLIAPGRFAQRHGWRVAASPIRSQLVHTARRLPLRTRLMLARTPRAGGAMLDVLLDARLHADTDGEPYYAVGPHRIYYRPTDYTGDPQKLREGALLIIREAYVRPLDLFHGPVQIRPGDRVLDLGGNLGTSALAFAPLVGEAGEVISFEPIFPDLLAKNLRANGCTNVRVRPEAVGEQVSEADFNVTDTGVDSRMGHSNGDGNGNPRPRRVPVTTVDHVVDEEQLDRVDFMKLDIEGAEELALRGARRTLERFRPKLSIASYHTDPTGEKQHPKLVRLLREVGYEIHEVGRERIYAW